VKYGFSAGAVSVTIAAENSTDRNTVSYTSTQPDLLAAVSMDVAGGKVTAVGVNHKNSISQGYAFLGAASMGAGPVTVGVYGGTSSGAVAYTGTANGALTNASDMDTNGTNQTSGTNAGAWATMVAGKGTLMVDYVQFSATNGTKNSNVSAFGVGYAYPVAAGFTVTPEYEYASKNKEGTTSASNTVYLRIQRDF